MYNKIYPCLWFDGNAGEAANFYCSIFDNSKIKVHTPMVEIFELEGQKFMGLNGGPKYKFNPAISLFVSCNTEEEVKIIWGKISESSTVLMPLGSYQWSNCYGWLNDKFGLSWQIMKNDINPSAQKIIPTFLFSGEQYGRGEEAIKLYTGIFPDPVIEHIQLYKAGETQTEGKLMHGQFSITNTTFAAMDGQGGHDFEFNEAVSFVVECESQDIIDYYWNKLTKDGEESQCGWLKDKFGTSWQIIPAMLGNLINDPEKGSRVMQALLQMKKIDIEKLVTA